MHYKVATALALLTVLGTARAIDYPPMKEGFWKIHMVTTSPGGKPEETTTFLCRDHVYDQHTHQVADSAMKSCSNISDSSLFGKRTISMTCKIGGSTVTSKSVITSTADTYYHSDSTTSYSPALYGQTQSQMVQEQTYLGACPAGMSPGDHKLADGSIQKHR